MFATWRNRVDAFGIGQAMIGMAKLYFHSSRRTGRTVSMIESAKDGDRFVFSNQAEAREVELRLRERNLKIECIVVPPEDPRKLFERGSSEGRTIFSHEWVERFYMTAMEDCQKSIDHLQRQSSGFGEAHFETRRKADEIARWQSWN